MCSNVKIDELHSKDKVFYALTCLGKSLFNQTVNSKDTLESLAEKYCNKANVIIISDNTDNTELIGLCAYYSNNNKSAFISILVIDKDKQNKGYGTILMNEVIQRCVESRMNSLSFEVSVNNTKAIHFHEKNGFKLYQVKNETLVYMMDFNN